MADPPSDDRDLMLEFAVSRVHRLLLPRSAVSHTTAAEAAIGRVGPPNDEDRRLIARQLRRVAARTPDPTGRDPAAEADALAATLVARAQAAVMAIAGGASKGSIGEDGAQALEAVLHMRGRPALRIQGSRLEPIDPDRHPESDRWIILFDEHEMALAEVAASTGAIRVVHNASDRQWVQGTGWHVGNGLVVTNRHVLLPSRGVPLCVRCPSDPTTARLRNDMKVTIDFAYDDGPVRQLRFPVSEILYISEDCDPVDVAVFRISMPAVSSPPSLVLATAPLSARYLYIIGHPCPLENVSEKVQAVFGSPDGRKRISPGERMDPDPARRQDLIHDASTIGGYSGGCVLGFLTREVAGIHYYGDPLNGNLAVPSDVLRGHDIYRFFRR